ncbi:putative amidohydrolase [Methanohalophilus levihalophilus]|uniref:carbon-nitrogen family hydrolase n=1 Tax=Methanohalophilus levihalophilus TaxID=1431282 RepID=UPI001AE2A9F0|nr:carbon-nitrogen family hydrolase [Methanohalophilus levihalophilus]MBP2029425.1 putative amidohydrolase [Methanohalophilus levihalophilus]
MKVACIQMDVKLCEKENNCRKALEMAEKAIAEGAEIIVLPEVFSTGFCYDNIGEQAERKPYPSLEPFRELSLKHDCVIIGSIIELQGDNQYSNMGFCIASGELTGEYRKTHPFKKENAYFSKGTEIQAFEITGKSLKIGLEICYEVRFPEVARKLALQGADILVTIAQFPDPRRDQWEILSKARAIENQIPHIACNRTGSDPGSSFFGKSMIIDALGTIVDEAGREEAVVIGNLDPALVKETRTFIPVFTDRRDDLY